MSSALTKSALAASFCRLLAERPFCKITVADIAGGCGLSRMTFYYHFEDVYALLDQGKEPELLEQYRERLCCIGRPVTVISPAGRYEAECVGLDENAHLLVKTADGQVNTLSSGEISIRL